MKGLFACTALALTAISAYAVVDMRQVTLESDGDRRVTKKVDHDGRVKLLRRLSDKPCIEGRTWGYDRSSIWVDDGCRAIFSYETNTRGDTNRGGIFDRIEDIFGSSRTGRTETQRIKVESDGNREYKRIDTSGGVRLLRRLSDKPCTQNRTWGYDRNGIWVDDGCRAEFEVKSYSNDRNRDRNRDRDDRGNVWLPGKGVPNWAIGNWQGIRSANNIDMRIRSDGTITIGRQGSLNSGRRGEVRGNRVEFEDMTFRLEKDGKTGIVLVPVDSKTGPLHFRRD